LGISDINVGFAFAMIVLFIAVAFTFSLHLLNRGERLRN
jgi:ABC-2 type transport system permease protein